MQTSVKLSGDLDGMLAGCKLVKEREGMPLDRVLDCPL